MSEFETNAEAILAAEELVAALSERDQEATTALLLKAHQDVTPALMALALLADRAIKDAAELRKKSESSYRRYLTSWILHVYSKGDDS